MRPWLLGLLVFLSARYPKLPNSTHQLSFVVSLSLSLSVSLFVSLSREVSSAILEFYDALLQKSGALGGGGGGDGSSKLGAQAPHHRVLLDCAGRLRRQCWFTGQTRPESQVSIVALRGQWE